jgi:integrase
MGRGIHRLSPLFVEKTKKIGRFADGAGLWFRTKETKNGGISRNWLFRYSYGGRKQIIGLGPTHTVSLAEARDAAQAARKLLLMGLDPRGERDRLRAEARVAALPVTTFKQAAQQFVDSHEAGWRNARHSHDWVRSMKQYVHPVIGDLPVWAITTDLVLRCLQPHWETIPNTMQRVRGRIERVLDWAKARGLRNGGDNPASWDILQHLLPRPTKLKPVEHHEALPFEEVPAFMARLRALDAHVPGARALEFCILCAARTGEARLAAWSEIEGDVWVVPSARTKTGREHRVPLCRRAMEIIEEMRGLGLDRELVFPGHGGHSGLRRVLARLGVDATVHGFRSAFRDWCGARTNFPREVAEMALAHRIGNQTEQAYARSDLFEKRRRLMSAWCEFCSADKPVGNVLPLSRNAV